MLVKRPQIIVTRNYVLFTVRYPRITQDSQESFHKLKLESIYYINTFELIYWCDLHFIFYVILLYLNYLN